jgi:glycerol-3-phosphate O-acyltransferase
VGVNNLKGSALQTRRTSEQKFDYRETSDIVQGFFAWRPGPASSALVRVLSKVMSPLEHGTYRGRALSGEPHRASWVIASPLTVFVLPEARYRHKLFLASRLRSTNPINMIKDPPEGSKAKRRFRISGTGRRLKRVSEILDKTGLSSSVHQDGDKHGYDHALEALLAIQHESAVSLTVVPVVRAYHQSTPDAPPATIAARVYRLSPWQLVRRVTNWARTVRTARVKNCRPLVLSKWVEGRSEEDLCSQAAALRVELMGNIESERRACTGPPLTPQWEVKRRVLADPVLVTYMQEYVLSEGTTREVAIAEAREHLDEIASDYRVGVVRYFVRAVDSLFDRLLEGIEVDREGIRFLSECDSRSRVVLVCCHKSYVDPLLIGYVMFRSGMVPPQQAAGINLNIWPIGWLLRHSGAFYMRRTFVGETLYREVFYAYIRYLLAENYTSVFYIEGTRSRDGKLARPKLGYLNILADSLRMGVCPDITLVPVYLGYDKVPEESAHVKEMAGGRKVSETVKGFARIYKSINTRLGRAYVKFGTPVSMKRLLEEHDLQETAEILRDGINCITPVTARSLAACALLAAGTTWVSADEFERAAEELLGFCERRRLPMSAGADFDGVKAAVDWFALEKHVVPEEREQKEGYKLEGSGRRFLEYNKNIPLGHFVDASLCALAWRSCGSTEVGDSRRSEEAIDFLKRLFEQEFLFSANRADEAWKLDHQAYTHILCSLIDSYLEAYLVACRALGALDPGEPPDRDDAVEMCFDVGERMLKNGEIRREESISRVAFKNAIKCYRNMKLIEERRQRDAEGEDGGVLVPGERFDELTAVGERIKSLLQDTIS